MGRPRTFDVDRALEAALRVFWLMGYDGASMAELTTAMAISPPTLYAAFGNKQSLFLQVIDRYGAQPGARVRADLGAPTAREGVERLLRSTVDLATDPGTPPGCLLVHGALVGGQASQVVRAELAALRNDEVAAVRERMERAVVDGDLPPETDTAALARHTMIVNDGLAVASLGGATNSELHSAVDMAMRAFPVSDSPRPT